MNFSLISCNFDQNLKKKENDLHSSLIEKVQELSSLKHQLGEKTNLATKLQKTLDETKSAADSSKSSAQTANSQLAQLRAQLESLREVSN
jgi:chromosome segregation ATPase